MVRRNHRNGFVELIVVANGAIHGAHPALANAASQAVR
jgi:hypothetical protein